MHLHRSIQIIDLVNAFCAMTQQVHTDDPFWNQQLQQRDEMIGALSDDVVDIHYALVDLSELIEEQRPQLNTIESNAESTHDRVTSATRNLEQAAESARQPMSKLVLCLFLLVIVLSSLVLLKFSVLRMI